jgi:endonuclease/exonuclease/phosphatase family metal-dependent hydrolase
VAVLTVATFNCEWRPSASQDASVIREQLLALRPDIICLTEAYRDFFRDLGHVIEADADYGYPMLAGRRKVLLWSREPWRHVDSIGDPGLPPGRFVAGTTATALGDVSVAGVCIPWSKAHVATGRRDRTTWEDHLAFLGGLAAWLPAAPVRTIVMGDFNQRVPQRYQPQHVMDALQRALLKRIEIATAGDIPGIGKQAIDHICFSPDLKVCSTRGVSNVGPDQRLVSDHFGVCVELT